MSFMYKTMMSRAPNKRKIKINEENLLSLMTNSDDEDEEDEDFTISSAKKKKKEQEDAGSDEEDSSSDSTESDDEKTDSCSEEQASKQDTDDDEQPGCSSQIRKPVRKRNKVAPCPTLKQYQSQVASDFYGLLSSTAEILKQAKRQWRQSENMVNSMKSWPDAICNVCLNEEKNKKLKKLATCQRCGISVHHDCYHLRPCGMKKKENDDPWICDSCIYGGDDVVCQFCPNSWGCMKETKCGRWVHIVCARNILSDVLHHSPSTSRKTITAHATLYIQLNDQMVNNSKQYGQKECVLCEERLVAKTGICIKCDAGLCKCSFHVTCAQRHGLLSRTQTSGDANNNTSGGSPDTHIANCPLHCNKEEMKQRQRSFILELKTAELKRKKLEKLNQNQQNDASAKLSVFQSSRLQQRESFVPPRPPLEQVPRLLSSDAHFTRLLNSKAEKMFGITTKAPALVIPKPTEIRKRHYVAPSLTTDFAAYFLDRQLRIEEEKSSLATAMKTNSTLSKQQEYERLKYNEIRSSLLACKSNRSDIKKEYDSLKQTLAHLTEWATSGKAVQTEFRRRKFITPIKRKPSRDLSVSPVSPVDKEHTPEAETLIDLKSCGICKGQEDQHLLVKCDVCRKWQHLGCLDPPLSQMPKRTKYSLWQCSECADSSRSSSSESEMENRGSFTNKDGRRLTRRLRRAPEKLAIGFPDGPPIKRSKGSIGHSKFLSKQQKRLRETLNTIARQQELQKRILAGEKATSPRTSLDVQSPPKKDKIQEITTGSPPNKTVADVNCPISSLRFGVSCDNHLSQAARIPIISQPKPTPIDPSWGQKQMRKIIILKKAVQVPHRPVGLGQSKKQYILLKKPDVPEGIRQQQKSPEKVVKREEKVCDVCKSEEKNKYIVTCDTCQKNYHWKCCDPPLKTNPVSKFATWECSDCVDKRDETEDNKGEVEEEKERGSSVNPEGRRIISRRRKPPELFEPAFKISNQQKIFRSIEKQKMRKIEHLANMRDMTMTAARCRSLQDSGWKPKRRLGSTVQQTTPLQLLRSISGISLSSFKRISIVNKESGKKHSVINLIPYKKSVAVPAPASDVPHTQAET